MSRLSFRLAVFASVLLVLFGFVEYAHAEAFYITDYNVDVYIRENSVVDLCERIRVHFNRPRHGIYRDIPYKYRLDGTAGEQAKRGLVSGRFYKLYIYNIETPEFPHKVIKKGRFLRIRVGSPDRYVKGDVTYKVCYSIFGAINFFKDHSEFYYNIIGTGWAVPIEHASFNIVVPKSDNRIRYRVFIGSYGSTQKLCEGFLKGVDLHCETDRPLRPHQGITALIYFPSGYLKNGSFMLKMRLFVLNNRVFFLPVGAFFVLLLLWIVIGKDEKRTIMTYYKPPEGVTPAEAGLLIDDKIDNRDLVSLIFYWASKGYLEIEEIEDKKSFFKGKDYILKKLKELPEDAKEFERVMFYGLFPGKVSTVRVGSLKNKFYKTMSRVRSELDRYVRAAELYEKGTRRISRLLMLIGLGVAVFGVERLVAGDTSGGIAYLVTGIEMIVFGRIMPKKTAEGLREYAAVKGFKEFMDRVEKNRLKVLLEEDPEYFYSTLAYAVAFGEHKKWADKFKDLVKEPPKWYRSSSYGRRGFSTPLFVAHLDHTVSAMKSAFVSSPAGRGVSGFSSGGGFSGGGMGGGGGGSW